MTVAPAAASRAPVPPWVKRPGSVHLVPGAQPAFGAPMHRELLDLGPWIAAASAFEMNVDFDVVLPPAPSNETALLTELMTAMKKQSAGKGTIQALGDKIILSRLLHNFSCPQMDVLFDTYRTVEPVKVEEFVEKLRQKTDDEAPFDIVVKPTHLSSGSGLLVLSKEKWERDGYTAAKLVEHMQKYLAMKADDSESEALKSLVPGFVVQPRYRSVVDFGLPLEMRVVTLWGKARLGVWWWGRKGTDKKGSRTAWLVRKPKNADRLDNEDSWEVLHQHTGKNDGYETAMKLFERAMPQMAAAAEGLATALGAPFLRSDFFVGSEKLGVRLNEVAYGSGCDLRRRFGPAPSNGGPCDMADDGPAVGQILREGYGRCQRAPSRSFLEKLGASGDTYDVPTSTAEGTPAAPGIDVAQIDPEQRRVRLDSETVNGMLCIPTSSFAPPLARDRCETQSFPNSPVSKQFFGYTALAAPAAPVFIAGPPFVGPMVVQRRTTPQPSGYRQVASQPRGSPRMLISSIKANPLESPRIAISSIKANPLESPGIAYQPRIASNAHAAAVKASVAVTPGYLRPAQAAAAVTLFPKASPRLSSPRLFAHGTCRLEG